MSTAKKIIIGVGLFIALIAGFIYFVFYITKGLPEAADKFFTLVQQEQMEEAYKSTSIGFQESTNYEQFVMFIDSTPIKDYDSAFWNHRSFENNQGKLEGSITTKSGETVPTSIDLIYENEAWKIYYINIKPSGFKGGEKTDMPSDDEIETLTNNTIQLFITGVENKDLTPVLQSFSQLFQSQFTVEELESGFQDFMEKDIDLSEVKNIKPVFNIKPSIKENGVLYLEGYYPGTEIQLNFILEYVYEHPEWKIVSIEVYA